MSKTLQSYINLCICMRKLQSCIKLQIFRRKGCHVMLTNYGHNRLHKYREMIRYCDRRALHIITNLYLLQNTQPFFRLIYKYINAPHGHEFTDCARITIDNITTTTETLPTNTTNRNRVINGITSCTKDTRCHRLT
jgi:hypothetical protein